MTAPIDRAAKALDGNFNPDRAPVLAAIPHIRAALAAEVRDNRDPAFLADLINDDYAQGHRTAARIVEGVNT